MSVDLSTKYLGLHLKNPLGLSASSLTGKLDMLRQLEDAGAAIAVLPSLFEEQIEHEEVEMSRLYDYYSNSFAESLTHFPELHDQSSGPADYLDHLEAAKRAVSIPVVGSLNGSSEGGWIRYAKLIEEAGADALELNIYFVPTNPLMTSLDVEQRYVDLVKAVRASVSIPLAVKIGPNFTCLPHFAQRLVEAGADGLVLFIYFVPTNPLMTSLDVEQRYVDLVKAVRASVSIPLAVKIGPNFTCLPHFAQRLVEAGADGLVLFNRYLEADIDLEHLQFKPDLVLSNRHEARVPLRWIAILTDELPRTSFAATSGVHRMEGVIKLLLAGADVTMMASILLMQGPGHLTKLLREMEAWLEEHEYESVEQLKGSMSRRNCPDPSALERANYMHALSNYMSKQFVP